MTLVLIFLVNAALSFALSLVLASVLGPAGFGRYAVGLSVALVINTALFEWLRLATTRFYSERVRQERPAVRATLDRAYLAGGLAVALLVGIAITLRLDLGLPGALLSAAASCGIAYGFSEYRMALARARFLDRPYILLTFLRALCGFLLAAGAALATGDPALVLTGAALGAFLPSLVVQGRLRDPAAAGAGFRAGQLGTFARYGVPIVAASALYQILPLLNRAALAAESGFVEAGYLGLASELATRLFQNLGTALDLVLFQLVVRADEEQGREAASRQLRRNLGLVVAVVVPAAAGWWLTWPSFEALFIPESFRGHLASTMAPMIPALAAFGLAQYGLGAVFQLRQRTAPVVATAALALLVDVALLWAWSGPKGPQAYAAAQLAGMAAALAVLAGTAAAGGARLPWRDLVGSAAAAAAMTAALWPSRGWAPGGPLLAGQVVAGAAVYGAVALALDVAGMRATVIPGRRRRARNP